MGRVVLIQVSDLHIGSRLFNSSKAFSAKRPAVGYNPHDDRLLRPLGLAIRDAVQQLHLRENETPYVIVSGDLTRSGVDCDYATAFALLHGQWRWKFSPPRRIGFGWSPDRTLVIPGNHDHWRSTLYPTAYSSGIAPAWFEETPWRRVLASDDDMVRVELYAVDSNSGFRATGANRPNLFARGRISNDQFEQLERLLEASAREQAPTGQTRVRALICHHAFSSVGGLLGAHPLEGDSRQEIERLARDYGISVALTGHTHSFHEQDWPLGPRAQKNGSSLKELRCATTLQGPAKAGVQGFWLHEIVASGDSRGTWTASKYQWSGTCFEQCPDPVTVAIPHVS